MFTCVAYSETLVSAVRAFNDRIAAAGETLRFPETPVSRWLPSRPGARLWEEYRLVLEGNQVRGAYILKSQPFWLTHEEVRIADFYLPISEGIADTQYGMVGMLMLKDALARCPLLFGLGMDGYQESIARLFQIMRWTLITCPFFFRVNRAYRFLRGLQFLRRKTFMRILADFGAFSGLGGACLHLWQRAREKRVPTGQRPEGVVVSAFEDWADVLWRDVRRECHFGAVRDRQVLDALYPGGSPRFIRVLFRREGRPVGWAVLLDTEMCGHGKFGHLRVGSIVDCLSRPGEEHGVVDRATRMLCAKGVDLIVSNQLHSSWCAAFREAGYFAGPSNFVLALSPQLAQRVGSFEGWKQAIHMTRGDGEGPVHL